MDNANVGNIFLILWEVAYVVASLFVLESCERGMCMVHINGQDMDVAGMSVAQYLKDNDYNKERVAIEINGNILPKADYEKTEFSQGDVVEVVSFVGGG